MIIDCHGHYTTAPEAHSRWRAEQKAAWERDEPPPPYPDISDSDIRASLEGSQIPLMEERGIDLTIFSPRASAMEHHIGDIAVSRRWAEVCNDLLARVIEIYPERYVGCAQLPQSPGAGVEAAAAELERAVGQLGFVGCNLSPDPSGGHWSAPPLTDRYWYPLYEKLVELNVPAMVHVSASRNPAFHSTGAHYINADTSVFMQLVQGDLFHDFPELRFIIPHGGGGVPYHWGRYRGLADMLRKPDLTSHVMRNVWFDTCVYHQAGIDLLFQVIDSANLLFGSEMVGAVRGIDPATGHYFDDTRRYIDALHLSDEEATSVFETNVRRVYPLLDIRLLKRKP